MDLMDPYKVIQRPHVSEKAHDYVQNRNTYTFRVHPEATKSDIKAAVKAIWNVDAKSVRNLPDTDLTLLRELNAYTILRRKHLLMTRAALAAIQPKAK